MGRLLVVGSVNTDLVVHVDARPRPGETVRGGPLEVLPGGKGANQAVAAALLGADVTLVGAVGTDGNAAVATSRLVRSGVDLSHVPAEPTATGTAVVVVTPDGENDIIISAGANGTVSPERAEAAVAQAEPGAVVLLQLELPAATVARTMRAAASQGRRVVLNAAPAAPLDADLLRICDPLVVNESEAAFLLGHGGADADPDGAVRELLGLGPRSVVVTLGARGCAFASASTPSDVGRLPAPAVTAVDTTGAGDAFVGAMAAALCDGRTLDAAARYAVVVGAIAVRRAGAQGSYPTSAEVDEFLGALDRGPR